MYNRMIFIMQGFRGSGLRNQGSGVRFHKAIRCGFVCIKRKRTSLNKTLRILRVLGIVPLYGANCRNDANVFLML